MYGLWVNLEDAIVAMKALHGEEITLEEKCNLARLGIRVIEAQARRDKAVVLNFDGYETEQQEPIQTKEWMEVLPL